MTLSDTPNSLADDTTDNRRRKRLVYNMHERRLAASPEQVADLVRQLGAPHDPIWPTEGVEPMRFDRPIAAGAIGGHGPIRYRVTEFDPARCVRFEFDPGLGLDGEHRFEIEAISTGSIVRHVIEGHPEGVMPLAWPLVVRWVHDEVLETCFDRMQQALGEQPPPRTVPIWTRIIKRLVPSSIHRQAAADRAERDAGILL